MHDAVAALAGGLVVSCQARPGWPLEGPHFMAALALCALEAGAVGIRANGYDDIVAIKAAVSLPLIGINKVTQSNGVRLITPTYAAAEAVALAGAEMIAVDCTRQHWPSDAALAAHLSAVATLGLPVMADIATVDEGVRAMRLGATFVATTMSGYTAETHDRLGGPDFELISALRSALPDVPVLAEGRIWSPAEAAQALSLGAHAVCVGQAITAPNQIARRFVEALS